METSAQRGVVRRKKAVEAFDLEMPKQADINIPITGDARIEGGEIEVATDIPRDEKAEMLRFLSEKVEIFLHDAYAPSDEQYVFCAVNGVPALPGNPYLKRGINHVISRAHVEQLAKARQTSYTQPFRDHPSEAANTMRPHTSLKYPFAVVNDPNPKGAAWIRNVMASS